MSMRQAQSSGMGIRYYAYPVHRDLTLLAEKSPRDFISDDPLADAWGPVKNRPPMLYLDKAWSYFQVVLSPDLDSTRPAFELVRGNVTHTSDGWIAYVRYLDPDQVREALNDLSDVGECEVMERLAWSPQMRSADEFATDVDYVMPYIVDAVEFLQERVERNEGLAYLIG